MESTVMHVIFRHNGTDRTYRCENRSDAETLYDTLALRYGVSVVELWYGSRRIC